VTPGLFDRLFDDAALFPPGDAPMAVAVPAHRRLHAELGSLVGPFVVPGSRLDELAAHLDVGPPLGVSLISPADGLAAALRRAAAVPGVRVAAVELTPAADAGAARAVVAVLRDALPPDVPAAVEVPRSEARVREPVLDVLAGTPYRAKLRTGGLRAELFPGPAELAETLHACVARGVALKCTAGLHHAVRHTDPATGFTHHGFLNVLAAVDALAGGGTPGDAAQRLGETRAEAVVAAVRDWSPDRTARVRAAFTSFGTCSVTEPVGDLVALGLLPAPAGSRA
jgi:hypothetical protein